MQLLRARTHPQDGPWSWFVCICASLSAVIVPGFAYSFGVLLPHLMEQFSSDRQSTAWVGSLAVALMTSVGVVSALLCDRFGCRCVTIGGSLLCVVSLVTSSFVTHLTVLYFTFGVLFGIGNSFVFTAGLLITPKYFTTWRSLAISIVAGGMGAGILTMGPTIQVLLETLEWHGTLRVMAAPMALVAVLGLVFDENKGDRLLPVSEQDRSVPVMNEREGNENGTSDTSLVEFLVCSSQIATESLNISIGIGDGDGDADKSENLVENHTRVTRIGCTRKKTPIDCSVWRIPVYSIITCSCILAFLVEYTPQIHLIKYTEEVNISQHKAARLYIFMGIATFLSRPLVGALCSISWIKAQYIYQIALFGNGVATLLLPRVTSYSGLVAYVVVYGVCDGAYITMLNVLILGCLDEVRRAGGFGMEMILASITTLVGPPLAGLIADHYGSYVPAFYVGGAISLAAGAMVFLLTCCNKQTTPKIEHNAAFRLENVCNTEAVSKD